MKHSSIYGIALLAGSLGAVITIFFHPVGADLLGQPDEIARRNEMITIATHSVALFSSPLLFLGFLGFSRRLGLDRNKLVHLFFLKFIVQISKKPNCHWFLVSKIRLIIIAQALKTSIGTSIVDLTDKQVNLN
jgi:hypothetical protein